MGAAGPSRGAVVVQMGHGLCNLLVGLHCLGVYLRIRRPLLGFLRETGVDCALPPAPGNPKLAVRDPWPHSRRGARLSGSLALDVRSVSHA